MNKPFIFAAQPTTPTSFNAEKMVKREQAFATKLGITFGEMEYSTCTETGNACDDYA